MQRLLNKKLACALYVGHTSYKRFDAYVEWMKYLLLKQCGT